MQQSLSVNWIPVKGLEVSKIGFWFSDPSKACRAYPGNSSALLDNVEAYFDLQSINHKGEGKRV